MNANAMIKLEYQYSAHNYASLPVVLTRGKGVYVWDVQDKRYLDMMSAYSAVSHGHCHPRLIKVLSEQAQKLCIVSRAFYTDKLAPYLQKACELTEQEKALPINTGVEAVETAIKASRKWGYQVKGIEKDKAEIIACEGNFHGRTLAAITLSSDPQYRSGFGPFPPGFKHIPYNDVTALEAAITPNTAAFIVEPIQGEGGIIVPYQGYLQQCAAICRKHHVLLICDEVQTGLGRTGKFLASHHENVKPDALLLGKALGGGLLPASLFLARREVMDVFTPGDHGSTFGGNPLASAVALEALQVIIDENLVERSQKLGDYFLAQLQTFKSPLIKAIRGKGLFIGIEIDPNQAKARDICLRLLEQGLLSKDTHETVVRLAPPLIITQTQIDAALEILARVLEGCGGQKN